jgi:endo-1,4-beta-xylanase
MSRRFWGSAVLGSVWVALSSCGESNAPGYIAAGAAGAEGACSAGQTLCSGSCTDTSTDPTNCGRCGNVCAGGTCIAGRCTSEDTGGAGSSGVVGTGGAVGTGGNAATGGAVGAAGDLGTGGAVGAGGAGTGGAGTGGVIWAGGAFGTGGDVGTGAAVGTGGDSATGGAVGAGGSSGGGSGSGGSNVGGSNVGGSNTGGSNAGGSNTGGSSGGGAGTGGLVTGPKFVGNITTYDSVDTDGRIFADYWDQISPENAGKWGSVQSSGGSAFNWRTLDAIYSYTEEHGIIFKEHTFIWGNQQPGGSISESQVRTWIQEFCSRYPNTRLIDVVNEPPPHTEPSYANAIGGGTNGSWQWIINAFTWAREACPNAILILNDYNIIEWSGDNSRFISLVQTLQAAGAPIDAIGAQAHDLDHGAVSFNTVQSLFAKLHDDTGLPVYITEMDISTSDDNAQLSKYEQYFPLFYESSYVPGITIWGWIYGKTWSPAPQSGLIRDGRFRPAMTYLMQQLGRRTD